MGKPLDALQVGPQGTKIESSEILFENHERRFVLRLARFPDGVTFLAHEELLLSSSNAAGNYPPLIASGAPDQFLLLKQ